MRAQAPFLLVTLFTVLFLSVSHQAKTETPYARCEELLPKAVENFVHSAFSGKNVSHTLKAYNDVLCEYPEHMANIAVVVRRKVGSPLYGIFHLHYNHDGSIPFSPVSFLENGNWVPLIQENDWQTEWCALVSSVYPEESVMYQCDKN